MFSNIYRGKKVLVTGDTGFKGSWLVLWLLNLGAEVIGYSQDVPSLPNHHEIIDLDYRKITGDICDLPMLIKTVSDIEPHIVFHLAAQSLVRKSYVEPIATLQVNILGTANVLEAIRNSHSVKAGIIVTSDKCYENNEKGKPFIEGDALGGHDPYSASKGAAEIVALSYFKSYLQAKGVLIATVRAGNVIGGGDWGEDRLVPDIMQAAAKRETVEIRSPQAIRPWQFVLEPLYGYLCVGKELLEGGRAYATSWNFGPDPSDHIPVKQLVDHLYTGWNHISCDFPKGGGMKLHEANYLSLNCEKAKSNLAWKPLWNCRKACAVTTEWYRSFYDSGEVKTLQYYNEFIEAVLRHEENRIL